jgi:phage tail sheath protein FI
MPPVLSYPGVYIEEVPSAVHTITGVATSIGAFVGWAPKGSTTEAVLVQSFSDYQREFGGLDARSLLGYSVSQFFNNGGSQAYVIRLASPTITTGTGMNQVPPGAGTRHPAPSPSRLQAGKLPSRPKNPASGPVPTASESSILEPEDPARSMFRWSTRRAVRR